MRIESIKKLEIIRVNGVLDIITEEDGTVYVASHKKLTIEAGHDLYNLYNSQPKRLNPETHKCTDGKLFIVGNLMEWFDIFHGWVSVNIVKCPLCGVRCDSLNSMET